MGALSMLQETRSSLCLPWMNGNEGASENVSHDPLEEFDQGVNDDLGTIRAFLGEHEDNSVSLDVTEHGDHPFPSNASWLGHLPFQEPEPPLVLERLPIELELEREEDADSDSNSTENDSIDQEETEEEDEASLDEHSQVPIIVLTPQDVLCNRGGESSRHPGNRVWWTLVLERRRRYVAIPEKDHIAKTVIAMEINAIIHQEGGRFLRRDRDTREINELPEGQALEKTRQGLRDRYVPQFAR